MDPITLSIILGSALAAGVGGGAQAAQTAKDNKEDMLLQAKLLRDRQWTGLGNANFKGSPSIFASVLGRGVQGAGIGSGLASAISQSPGQATSQLSNEAATGREAESMYAKDMQMEDPANLPKASVYGVAAPKRRSMYQR